MSYLTGDSSRSQTSRVTYWIAYCKVTHMGNARRLKIDGGIPNQLARAADTAAALERDGYDGGWTAETSHDPFLPLLLAAEHTSRLEIGTNIAVAFARNPMIVANIGWDLQAYSAGRFVLGLGTQIQPHIEKRFSMSWSHPARRMREFVSALHAIWSAWRDGTELRFEGDFYTHKIMTPMFTPEPQPYASPKIFLAAVGETMTEMCGEVADGHLGHPMVSKRYLDEVTLPALLRGMQRSGRDRGDFEVSGEVLVATGENDANWRPPPPPCASRSPSTDRPRPTARSWSCMAGGNCKRNCTASPLRGNGTPWARSSTTRCWRLLPSSDRSTRLPGPCGAAARVRSTASCRSSSPLPRPV